MAKPLVIIPLLILCVSAASGQGASEIPIQSKDSNITLTCRPQKPLSHIWICVDQNGKEIRNLLIKDREAK
jgi:hypothetical protein